MLKGAGHVSEMLTFAGVERPPLLLASVPINRLS